MNLVASVTLDANGPMPSRQTARLTLEIELRSYDGPIDPRLAEYLNRYFDGWDEGRYPLYVEMIDDALCRLLHEAEHAMIEADMRAKYGNEMVEVGPKHHRARACIEAEQAPHAKPLTYLPYTAKITEVSHESR